MHARRSSRQTVHLGGAPQPERRLVHRMTLALSVRRAEGEPHLIAARVRRVRQEIAIGEQTARYDSAGPPAEQHPALARALEPLTAVRLTLLIGADGRVVRVRGLDAHWDELAERHVISPPLLARLRERMTNERFARWFDRSARLLPDGTPAPGAAWQRRFTSLVAGAESQTTLEFAAEAADEGVRVTLSGSRRGSGDADPPRRGAALRKLESTLRGVIVLDAAGMPRRLDIEEQGGMDYVADTPAGAVEMRIDQTVSTTVTVAPAGEPADTPGQPASSDE
ncbi:MAG: hypothetical protein ACOC8F_08035 [Planctomycetota bacterium]